MTFYYIPRPRRRRAFRIVLGMPRSSACTEYVRTRYLFDRHQYDLESRNHPPGFLRNQPRRSLYHKRLHQVKQSENKCPNSYPILDIRAIDRIEFTQIRDTQYN